MIRLIHGDCLDVLRLGPFDCVFADPPDGIGLQYDEFNDRLSPEEYLKLLEEWVKAIVAHAKTAWISFNVRWLLDMAVIAKSLDVEVKPCVQVISFGQHNHHDFGNCHRPLWRFQRPDAPFYPDQIRVPSWRQLNGDKRADPRGKVPSDVFSFPRVTGNSKQRRSWHPTQLHEDLVARCIASCTREGDTVCDPFAGTGTTLRVCKRIGRRVVTCDMDRTYCERIAEEHGLVRQTEKSWLIPVPQATECGT